MYIKKEKRDWDVNAQPYVTLDDQVNTCLQKHKKWF